MKGTTNFGNQSTVGLTIEQQKIVLQSFKVSSDNLVSEDSDIYAKGASNSVGIGPDGKIMLGTTVTTGDTKVFRAGGIIRKYKCKV